MRPFSNSELSTWQRCKRLWYLKYYLEIGPGDEPLTGSRQLGLRVHQAFEADLKTEFRYGPVHWLEQLYGAEVLSHPEYALDLEKERDLAVTMISGYLEWAAEEGVDEGVELVAAETDMQVPMPGMDGIFIRGRLDQLIRRRRDDALLFRDWKTVGGLDQAGQLVRNPQMRFYALIHALYSGRQIVDGGQVVYIKRSKRTAAAKPPFYELNEVRYNKDVLNATYSKAYAVIMEIMQAREKLDQGADHHLAVYPTQTGSCEWECPFKDMCDLMDDGSRWQDMAKYEFVPTDPYGYYDRPIVTNSVDHSTESA